MRRLIFIACTAAIGSGIFWMLRDTERSGSETSSLEKPSIKKEKTKTKRQAENPPSAQKSIRSIPPQPLYTWPVDPVPEPEKAEVKERLEVWAAKPHFREVKNIVPPIEGVLPPASATLVTEEVINEGGIIDLGFKAFLHLPADALVDEWGKPIDEPVKISYCPLSDPVDVYLSGVPMSYDSAGITETFRTAGMVRLEAETYSGKKVRLKKGQSMRLDMPTVATTDDFNFYTFNEGEGAWKFEKVSPPARPAIDLVLDTMNIEYPFDTVAFDEKFDNMAYHYLTNKQVKRQAYKLHSGRLLTSAMEKSIREALYYSRFSSTNLIRLIATNPIIGFTDKEKPIREVRFKLDVVGKGSTYFRELRHFSGFSFVQEDVKNLQEFYRGYRRGRKFHDIRIEYQKGDDHCTLVLKDEKEIIRLKARISRGVRAGFTDVSKLRFLFSYERYLRDLKKKEEVHDELIQKEKRTFFVSRFGNRISNGFFSGQVYRQLNIPGFATYNCDQIARMTNPLRVASRFVDEHQKSIRPDQVIVCDKKVRAIFYFISESDAKCSKDGFGFALINADGKTYYLPANEKKDNTGFYEFVVKELPEIETGEQLRALLTGN